MLAEVEEGAVAVEEAEEDEVPQAGPEGRLEEEGGQGEQEEGQELQQQAEQIEERE